eukprot:TRINITY_DN8293_c0_g1_i3.p1 TRINITY_DN8293_c0_g1~~TRINITY_DN8293_c0_g1_i3.p1  ORF type:complete len:469 (-),score=89.55 TRINITY_DN8293_c0_g1_i3:139-1545(-)
MRKGYSLLVSVLLLISFASAQSNATTTGYPFIFGVSSSFLTSLLDNYDTTLREYVLNYPNLQEYNFFEEYPYLFYLNITVSNLRVSDLQFPQGSNEVLSHSPNKFRISKRIEKLKVTFNYTLDSSFSNSYADEGCVKAKDLMISIQVNISENDLRISVEQIDISIDSVRSYLGPTLGSMVIAEYVNLLSDIFIYLVKKQIKQAIANELESYTNKYLPNYSKMRLSIPKMRTSLELRPALSFEDEGVVVSFKDNSGDLVQAPSSSNSSLPSVHFMWRKDLFKVASEQISDKMELVLGNFDICGFFMNFLNNQVLRQLFPWQKTSEFEDLMLRLGVDGETKIWVGNDGPPEGDLLIETAVQLLRSDYSEFAKLKTRVKVSIHIEGENVIMNDYNFVSLKTLSGEQVDESRALEQLNAVLFLAKGKINMLLNGLLRKAVSKTKMKLHSISIEPKANDWSLISIHFHPPQSS